MGCLKCTSAHYLYSALTRPELQHIPADSLSTNKFIQCFNMMMDAVVSVVWNFIFFFFFMWKDIQIIFWCQTLKPVNAWLTWKTKKQKYAHTVYWMSKYHLYNKKYLCGVFKFSLCLDCQTIVDCMLLQCVLQSGHSRIARFDLISCENIPCVWFFFH